MSILREFPYGNANFEVVIDGLERTAFDEVILPELIINPEEVREGDVHIPYSRKFPGHPAFTNAVLRRGYSGSLALYQWWLAASHNTTRDLQCITIALLDEDHNSVTEWKLVNVFPVRYSFTPLNSLDGSPLIETLEVSCDSVEML